MTAQRQTGASKLEFSLVVTLVAILGGLLLNRLVALEAGTERLAVDLTVRNLRVGLALAKGERIMAGREDRLAELLDWNPAAFLGRPDLGPGWHYDPASRLLSYRPRQPEAFAGRSELHWRLTAVVRPGGRIERLQLREEAAAG